MKRPDLAPVRFFNRYTGEIEEEAIYGEAFLRWAYETVPGRLTVAAVAGRPLFSRWYGWRMDRAASRAKVAPFIDEFGVEMGDFVEPPGGFRTFNEFFYRKLAPGARPVAEEPGAAVFPADGRHLAVPELGAETAFFVKGQRFDLGSLLGGDRGLADRFEGGTLVLSRLCPVDYHRFHFPCAGSASAAVDLPGALYSVNPVALRRRLAYLWQNKRSLTLIESPLFGGVAMLEIGATCVGSIRQTASLPGEVEKGQEKGLFAFGGSSVVTVFERGRFELAGDLLEHSSRQTEVYAKMGDAMGRAG